MKKLLRILISTLCAILLATGAYAEDVLLGAGDILKLSVYGHPDLSLETRVSAGGSITFPLLGEVPVGGLPPSDAEKKIATLLETKGYIKNPQVNIIVAVIQSQQVSVLGQVNKPGRYPMDGIKNITDALALAGGVNSEGGDVATLIRVRDGKSQKFVIDLKEMVLTGDVKQNMSLSSNDVVYVERAPKFYIYGEVQRPGAYRLEKDMTVLQAISTGGGLTPRGTEKGIRIKRRDANNVLQTLSVTHDDVLRVDDVVYVKESLF